MLMQMLKLTLTQLSRPLLKRIEEHVYRLVIAVAVIALGISCLIICLAYLGTALRQSLVPVMGLVGADVLLGVIFGLVATVLIFLGLRAAR